MTVALDRVTPERLKKRFPRSAFKGFIELHDLRGGLSKIANVYLHNDRGYVVKVENGFITHELPGSFDPKDFEMVSGVRGEGTSRFEDEWKLR